MKKVFVINGSPGVGKTAFGTVVKDILKQRNINFVHTSSIDPIKNILLPRHDWSDELIPFELRLMFQILKNQVIDQDWDGKTKNPYWRAAMSELKSKVVDFRPEFIDYWLVNAIHLMPEPAVVFVDIREPENIKIFKEFCIQNGLPNIETVLVEGDVKQEVDNASDLAVYQYGYNIIVNNFREDLPKEDALKNLQDEAEKFIEENVMPDFEDREGAIPPSGEFY